MKPKALDVIPTFVKLPNNNPNVIIILWTCLWWSGFILVNIVCFRNLTQEKMCVLGPVEFESGLL